jgi:tRNA-Thr(GGU) m(6)t(6)A37 methyltransferase TsaA
MTHDPKRDGEVSLPFDPAMAADGTITFIGHLSTPWEKGHCPKNLTEARRMGGLFSVHVDDAYRAGLTGLSAGMHIILLYWMAAAQRDLILQRPSHKPVPTGTFALRSPARPNPIALAVVTVLDIDLGQGVVTIDGCDAFDGTPLIDIKPWLHQVDVPPALSGQHI